MNKILLFSVVTIISAYLFTLLTGCHGTNAEQSQERLISISSPSETPFSFSGVVIDSESNRPLEGVKVNNQTDGFTTVSDSEGKFTLSAKTNQEKQITYDSDSHMFTELSAKPSLDQTVVLVAKKLSSARKRWNRYLAKSDPFSTDERPQLSYKTQPGWQASFKVSELKGDFAPDINVTRRDPSAVIQVDGVFYTYYSHCIGEYGGFGSGDPSLQVFPWDLCDIYYATSTDGWTWDEQGVAVKRGKAGQFDDRSVFTPEVLHHEDKFYLVYQAVKAPYVERVKNTVAMSWATNPNGPWTKLDKPILFATNNGKWLGDKDDRLAVVNKGDFDSHKVHDPTLLHFNNKFYLYYKGERMGEQRYWGQREIKWGVAISDHPFGPYKKSPYNPITNSGHELVIWKYADGIALINTLDGPERRTIQFAKDGVNFEIMDEIEQTLPHAQGLFRSPVSHTDPLMGVNWGLGHEMIWTIPGGWMYIYRFDLVRH